MVFRVGVVDDILVRVDVSGFLFNDFGFFLVVLGGVCLELWEYEGC